MTIQARQYADVGRYPHTLDGRPVNPGVLHGGIIAFPEWKEGCSIVYVSCRAYKNFPVTEFVEVIW